jgi:hypothetical protein
VKRLSFAFVLVLGACVNNSPPPARPAQGQANLYGPQQPQQGYPQQPNQPGYYPQQPPTQPGYPQQPQQPGYPQPPVQPPVQPKPLLAPLVGSAAMQQEVRGIMGELIAVLPPAYQAKVKGIPLQFQPTNEINAYAGCENGSAFMAGTEGFLIATDAIAQTKATDELFGTQTYEAYTAQVIPQIVKSEAAVNPALPAGMIPAQYLGNAQRLSRAREIFGDVVAFTFGHELGHHYLGHTGCANGQAANPLLQIASHVIPAWSQLYETQADQGGCVNALDAGRNRRPNYRWSEKGGVILLDFFARLERAAGGGLLNPLNLLRSHPYPGLRIPMVQQTAQDWYRRNPGVQ